MDLKKNVSLKYPKKITYILRKADVKTKYTQIESPLVLITHQWLIRVELRHCPLK